jgi:hypothetical protein
MQAINVEISSSNQAWISTELKMILRSLKLKLNKKIKSEAESDFLNAVLTVGSNNDSNSTAENAIQSQLKSVISNCLSLLKSIELEPEADIVSNVFHVEISKIIAKCFGNESDVESSYTKALAKLKEMKLST